jgi:hypothetical protein
MANEIERLIQNAVVKVIVGESQGSGFFISKNGYILTAYHCIGENPPKIKIDSPIDGTMQVDFIQQKSLRKHDIAVLKASVLTEYYLPLGGTENNVVVTDTIVAVGYPVIDKAENASLFKGTISNLKEHEIYTNNTIKGKGQSGGPIYHYNSGRVIGIAIKTPSLDKAGNGGSDIAVKVSLLLNHWEDLKRANELSSKAWDALIAKYTEVTDKHIPNPPLTDESLNDNRLFDTILELINEVFIEDGEFKQNESVNVLIALGIPNDRIENIKKSGDFWRQALKEIKRGIVNNGINRLLKEIARIYPHNQKVAKWR